MRTLRPLFRARDARGARFTILTCDVDATLARIHDRMPVIVPREAFGSWLDGSVDEARMLLAGLPETPRVATPVRRRVNDPKHDDPGCIAPVPDGRDGPRPPGL